MYCAVADRSSSADQPEALHRERRRDGRAEESGVADERGGAAQRIHRLARDRSPAERAGGRRRGGVAKVLLVSYTTHLHTLTVEYGVR